LSGNGEATCRVRGDLEVTQIRGGGGGGARLALTAPASPPAGTFSALEAPPPPPRLTVRGRPVVPVINDPPANE